MLKQHEFNNFEITVKKGNFRAIKTKTTLHFFLNKMFVFIFSASLLLLIL